MPIMRLRVVSNGSVLSVVMQKIIVSLSDDMVKALDQERKARKLESIPETIRSVLGEYFKKKDEDSK